MFRKLSLLNPQTEFDSHTNWRTLDINTKSKVFTPTLTSTTGVITPGTCVATLYGPIVFFVISLSVPNTAGVTTSTTISLPYEGLIHNGTLICAPSFEVYVPTTGVIVDSSYLSTSKLAKFVAGYINSSGSTQTVNIQGWYFRN